MRVDVTEGPDLIEPEAAAELLGVSVRQLWRYKTDLAVVKLPETVAQRRLVAKLTRESVELLRAKLEAKRSGTPTSES